MRIFSKYVFRQAAGSFALIMVSLTGIVWIALALRQFVRDGYLTIPDTPGLGIELNRDALKRFGVSAS